MASKTVTRRPVLPTVVLRDAQREARAVAVAKRFGLEMAPHESEHIHQFERRVLDEIAGPAEARKWH